MDIKKRVFEILENGHLLSLATVDDGGPWVSDVIFIFDDDLNLYWMSDPDCRHSCAVRENPSVAGTITLSKKSKESNLGIQFEGIAEKINGVRFDLAKKHFKKRGHEEPSEEQDVLEGDSWYKLVPSKIELIDEEHFGYEKQELKL